MKRFTLMESPIDPLMLVTDGQSLVGLYMGAHQYMPKDADRWERDDEHPVLLEVKRQLEAYFRGEQTSFDLPLNATGTEFQKKVWQELSRIPYGVTISYGELARRIGQPTGSRAVGLANGKNPISIVVPCHRVIGANGALTGFGGGIDRKRFLLELEKQDLFSGSRS